MPWLPIMAGLTVAQMASSAAKESRDRQLAAATQRYSPWTGLQAQPVQSADPVGTATKGFGAGVAMDQNMDSAKSGEALRQAQIKLMNRSGNMQDFNSMSGGDGTFGGSKNPWGLGDYSSGSQG